jgi:YD repeat-containing protein
MESNWFCLSNGHRHANSHHRRLGRVTTFLYDAADRLVEERWQ